VGWVEKAAMLKGNPINKFRGFNRDTVFLLPRGDAKRDALCVSKYIFFLFFINKFSCSKPCRQRAKIIFSSFCPLPSALCLSSVISDFRLQTSDFSIQWACFQTLNWKEGECESGRAGEN
jgi:hypothetical protein